MATSGIRRKVDDLGRVVIPAQIRRTLGIREGDSVEVTLEGERIVLARPRDACVFCGREDDDLLRFRNRLVCRDCVRGVGAVDERARTSLDDPWAPLTSRPTPRTAPPPTPAAAPSPPPAPSSTPAASAADAVAATSATAATDAETTGRVPPEVLARRGVLDGDAWARAQARDDATSPARARDDAQPPEDRPEPEPPVARPADDPASTTAW